MEKPALLSKSGLRIQMADQDHMNGCTLTETYAQVNRSGGNPNHETKKLSPKQIRLREFAR